MEPMSMNRSHFRLWATARSILLSGIGLALLASCSNLGYSSSAGSNQQDTASTSDPEALSAEFSFPQPSCGEQATQPSGTWYVVYIDGANPDEVRREYCRDAIGTVRDKTGAPTVQVASLTDYSKALKLATAVGGEVETTVSSPSANPSASPSTAASPTNSPTATNDSSGTAHLTAADPASSINVRESASTSAPIKHTGRSGDQVRIAEQQQGDDGRTWYKVSLQSGQEGWVRSDFVTRESATNTTSATTTTTANAGSTGTNSFNSGNVASNSGGTTSSTPQTSASSTNSSYASTSASSSGTSSYSTDDRSTSQPSASSSSGQYSTSTSSSDRYTSDQSASDQYSTDTAEATLEDSSDSEDSFDSSVAAGDSATLVSDNPESRINIRDDASTTADIQHTGYAGDPVQIIDSIEGEDGYTWYQVEFDSGAVGWVRGDLISGG